MTTVKSSAPTRLDREQILDVAERVVRTEGLSVLTMRRIGIELGADPTAVYRHFRNKDELLAQLAERIFANECEIDSELPWQEQLRLHLRHAFLRYRAHPDLGVLLASQSYEIEPLIRLCEFSLHLLVDGAGLTLAQAAHISNLLENHVVGCGLFAAICDHAEPPPDGRQEMRRVYAALPEDRYPLAQGAAEYLFEDPDETFEETTELLIAAAERIAQGTAQVGVA